MLRGPGRVGHEVVLLQVPEGILNYRQPPVFGDILDVGVMQRLVGYRAPKRQSEGIPGGKHEVQRQRDQHDPRCEAGCNRF